MDAILRELPMSDDGTGHIADCGYTEADPSCGCLTLPERIAARVAEAADAREAEVRAEWAPVQALADRRDVLYPAKFAFGAAANYVDGYRAAQADLRAALAPADNDGEAP